MFHKFRLPSKNGRLLLLWIAVPVCQLLMSASLISYWLSWIFTSVPRIEAVNGDLLSLVGCIQLDIQLSGRTIVNKFYVLKDGSSGVTMLVLGNDFGRAAKLVISPDGPSVYFEDDYHKAILLHCCPVQTKEEDVKSATVSPGKSHLF